MLCQVFGHILFALILLPPGDIFCVYKWKRETRHARDRAEEASSNINLPPHPSFASQMPPSPHRRRLERGVTYGDGLVSAGSLRLLLRKIHLPPGGRLIARDLPELRGNGDFAYYTKNNGIGSTICTAMPGFCSRIVKSVRSLISA